MKTTVDIADDIAREAKALAASKGVTFRELIEQGLCEVLRADKKRHGFRLRDAAVGGNGLQDEFAHADWDAIRAAAYGGRGG